MFFTRTEGHHHEDGDCFIPPKVSLVGFCLFILSSIRILKSSNGSVLLCAVLYFTLEVNNYLHVKLFDLQGQCLLNISGDAVKVFYEEDELLDNSGRGSPRKRTLSYSEANSHTPIQIMRQRSVSASETSSSTLITYDPYYGTEI